MQAEEGRNRLPALMEQEIVRLYESEARGMLSYAASIAGNLHTAQDAVQETFIRFFIARSAGQDFQSPKAWLFRVLRNYIIDQKRARVREEVGIESAVAVPCPHSQSAGDSTSQLLQRALQVGLSAREAECVRLRAEGLTYEEIGGVLRLQSGTVGALLARAHEKMRVAARQSAPQGGALALPLAGEKRYAS
jgi:RNA polymerase sigma-70 factor (ECF subfamily)